MDNLWQLLEELRVHAANGLHYANNHYDRERYGRLLELASGAYADLLELPAAEVRRRFGAELGTVTPKVGANAAIFDGEGRILLVRRADNERWCLPCGWMEPDETIAETAVRETWEEAGLRVAVRQLVDVISHLPGPDMGPHTFVSVVYLCEVTGGEVRGSHEGEELAYWEIEAVADWHMAHREYALAARAAWRERLGPGA
ncbi:MAG TPA: NUDIX hydrolase N-terminal domain-containing protein [Herpetosiphonaceae bacterium]